MFYLVVSSLGPVFDCRRRPLTKGIQGVCGGVDEIGVGFQQQRVAGSKARQEGSAHSFANGHATFGYGQPTGGGSMSVLWMRDLADA